MAASSPQQLAFSAAGRRARTPTIARLMALALENPRVLSLAAGFTDNQSLPVAAIEAATISLAHKTGEPEFLQYGTNRGRPGLRNLLGERLRRWEPDLAGEGVADRILVTNGSQQSLYLAVQVLCDEGDIVLVDRPSYFVFLEMLTGLGVRARSLPVGQDGRLDEAGLESMLTAMRSAGEIDRIRAVYFVSYFSNPSGRTLTAAEKNGLARVLREHDLIVPVIEDAAYRELFFRSEPEARSVIGMKEWRAFPVFYLTTLTKPFATGIKIGCGYCTHDEWLARMLHVKGHQDFGSPNFNQAIMEVVLGNGDFDRHLARIRPAYEAKMRVLHEALRAEGLPKLGWVWRPPEGGLYLWLRAPESVDTGLESAFCRACIEEGVIYVPGALCYSDRPRRNHVRLSYGVLDAAGLREAARRFGRVAQRFAVPNA